VTASNYRPSLSLVLQHEGGYVNHPKDPGGATNFGVTQKVYDAYRHKMALAPRSVKLIDAVEVQAIYEKNYWRLVRGDSLPCGLDYAVFDFAVNSGVSRAVRYLQRLVGVDDDGALGDVTLNAVYDYAKRDEEGMIVTYCANRMAFLRSLGTFATFGRGWTRRVIGDKPGVQANDKGVVDYAVMMARKDEGYVAPVPIGTLPGEVPGKAEAPLEPETFPTVLPTTLPELKGTLAEINDQLAALIAAS
jgi:lysozyme family protein